MGRIPCKVICAPAGCPGHHRVSDRLGQDDHSRRVRAGELRERPDPHHRAHPGPARPDRPGVAGRRPPDAHVRGVLAGKRCGAQLAGRTDHHEPDPARAVGRNRAGRRVRHVRLPRGPRGHHRTGGPREDSRTAGDRSGGRRAAVRAADGPVRPRHRGRSALNHGRARAPLGRDPRQHPDPCGLPALPHRHAAHPRCGPPPEGRGRPGGGDREHVGRPGRPVRRLAPRGGARAVGGDRTGERSSPGSRSTSWRSAIPRRFSGSRRRRGGAGGWPCCRPHFWSTRRRTTCVRS